MLRKMLLDNSAREMESICIRFADKSSIHRSARVSCSMVHSMQRRSIALISCLEQERCLMPRRN